MKFSILISSFNKGRYIEDCIKSCLNQNYSNFEVILFDNLSTDQSNKIFKVSTIVFSISGISLTSLTFTPIEFHHVANVLVFVS